MVKQAEICAHILQSRDRSGQPRGSMLLGSIGQWLYLYAVVCAVTYMYKSIYVSAKCYVCIYMLIYAKHVYLCDCVHVNLLTAKWKNQLIHLLFCRGMTDKGFGH